MPIKLRRTSRLRFAKRSLIEGVEAWDLPEYPDIQPANDDITYRVAKLDRIDNLSYRFYDSKDLWWIIALRNDLRLLPNDLKPYIDIYIPSPRRVFNEILRHPSRGIEGK